jgi:hypothetical protein
MSIKRDDIDNRKVDLGRPADTPSMKAKYTLQRIYLLRHKSPWTGGSNFIETSCPSSVP